MEDLTQFESCVLTAFVKSSEFDRPNLEEDVINVHRSAIKSLPIGSVERLNLVRQLVLLTASNLSEQMIAMAGIQEALPQPPQHGNA